MSAVYSFRNNDATDVKLIFGIEYVIYKTAEPILLKQVLNH